MLKNKISFFCVITTLSTNFIYSMEKEHPSRYSWARTNLRMIIPAMKRNQNSTFGKDQTTPVFMDPVLDTLCKTHNLHLSAWSDRSFVFSIIQKHDIATIIEKFKALDSVESVILNKHALIVNVIHLNKQQ